LALTRKKSLKKTKTRRSLPGIENNHSILVREANIWTPNGIRKGSILIENGKIKKISKRIISPVDDTIIASKLLALPGLTDVHVHLRDLELAYKETFTTGTAAAAAGGFTTVLDMPNSLPPTDSARRLKEKQAIANGRLHVHVGFHAAAVRDSEEIERIAAAGAFSLKLYMPRPISPLNLRNDDELLGMMRAATKERLPLSVHAEDPGFFDNVTPRSFLEMARARNPESEEKAIGFMLSLQKIAHCSLHFCHLTLASSLRKISGIRSQTVSSEVTPHHLILSEKSLANVRWKAWMVPPLRTERNRRELFDATMNGKASMIGSDHAPHTLKEKNQSPTESLPGVPGLETTMPVLLTLVKKRAVSLDQIISLLSINPRKIFGLEPQVLQAGAQADVVLIDPKKRGRIDASKFLSKAKYSPFDNFRTIGSIHSTIIDGRLVYDHGRIVTRPGAGRILRRNSPS
jgi:dihydroorotase